MFTANGAPSVSLKQLGKLN